MTSHDAVREVVESSEGSKWLISVLMGSGE